MKGVLLTVVNERLNNALVVAVPHRDLRAVIELVCDPERVGQEGSLSLELELRRILRIWQEAPECASKLGTWQRFLTAVLPTVWIARLYPAGEVTVDARQLAVLLRLIQENFRIFGYTPPEYFYYVDSARGALHKEVGRIISELS